MDKRPPILIGAICLAYIALRLWGLTDSCLWFDEIFGVHAAEHPWGEMLWFVAQDLIHPPLFYILLKIWIGIGGDGLLWLRLLPVFFSILSIFPFLQLCREIKLKLLTVVVALGLFTVNGALIKYAQEVRMYSLLLFLSLMSIWLFARFFIKGKSFAALIVVNILLVYTHYFGWLVVGSEIVAILLFQRIKLGQILMMSGIAAISFVPWTVAVYRAAVSGSELGQNIGWIERPGIGAIFDFVFDVVEPFYFQASNAEASSLLYISIPLLVLIGVAKVLYYTEWKTTEDKNGVYLLSVFTAVPFVMVLIVSWLLPYSVWGSRHLIIVYAPMLFLSAIFIAEIAEKKIRLAVIGVLLLIISAALLLRFGKGPAEYVWCGWERMGDEVEQIASVGEDGFYHVYAFEDLSAYHLWFRLRREPRFRVFKVEGIEGLAEDKAYFLPRGFREIEVVGREHLSGRASFAAYRTSGNDVEAEPLRTFAEVGLNVNVRSEIKYGNVLVKLVELK